LLFAIGLLRVLSGRRWLRPAPGLLGVFGRWRWLLCAVLLLRVLTGRRWLLPAVWLLGVFGGRRRLLSSIGLLGVFGGWRRLLPAVRLLRVFSGWRWLLSAHGLLGVIGGRGRWLLSGIDLRCRRWFILAGSPGCGQAVRFRLEHVKAAHRWVHGAGDGRRGFTGRRYGNGLISTSSFSQAPPNESATKPRCRAASSQCDEQPGLSQTLTTFRLSTPAGSGP
jgi:hypothetical protein